MLLNTIYTLSAAKHAESASSLPTTPLLIQYSTFKDIGLNMFFTDIKVDIKKNWHLYISISIHIYI